MSGKLHSHLCRTLAHCNSLRSSEDLTVPVLDILLLQSCFTVLVGALLQHQIKPRVSIAVPAGEPEAAMAP